MKRKLLIISMLMSLILLLGCGTTRQTKLTATKTENNADGGIECSIEIVFSNGVVSTVKEERKFSNKDSAEEYYQLLVLLDENDANASVEKYGDKVTETVSATASSYKYYGMSRQLVVNALESDNWIVGE